MKRRIVVAAALCASIAQTTVSPALANSKDGSHDSRVEFVKIIVHRENPLGGLDVEQVTAILKGKIVNWSELGGPDVEIVVVTEKDGANTKSLINTILLDNQKFTEKAIQVANLTQIQNIVSRLPEAIGYGTFSSITPTVTVVPSVLVKPPESQSRNQKR